MSPEALYLKVSFKGVYLTCHDTLNMFDTFMQFMHLSKNQLIITKTNWYSMKSVIKKNEILSMFFVSIFHLYSKVNFSCIYSISADIDHVPFPVTLNFFRDK